MDISFDVIWQTVLLAMAPVSEIRGSIIWGLANVTHNAANILSIYLISVVANFIPVPFILLLFRPVIRWLKRTRLFGRPLDRVLEENAQKSRRYFKKGSQSRSYSAHDIRWNTFSDNGRLDGLDDSRSARYEV